MKKLFHSLLLSLAMSSAWGQGGLVITSGSPTYANFDTSNILLVPDANSVWGVVTYRIMGGNTGSYAYSTGDNGLTWSYRNVALTSRTQSGQNVGTTFIDLSAVDAQNAWVMKANVVGSNTTTSVLAHTTSGTGGFVDLPNPLPAQFAMIHFFTTTAGVGIASSTVGGVDTWTLYRTIDAGATWAAVPTATPLPRASGQYIAAKHAVGGNLWLITSNGNMLRTVDAGLTWSSIPNGGGRVAFESDALHGLSYSSSRLQRTSDGGQTWTPVAYSGMPSFRTITAVPGLPGTYISGTYDSRYTTTSPVENIYTGTMAISRDYGSSWQVLLTNNIPIARIVARSATELWVGADFALGAQVGPAPNQPVVYRYGNVSLASKKGINAEALEAYPNPANGLVQLAGPLRGNETVRVYDAAGRLCQTGQVSEAQRTVDLSGQRHGLYQLVITSPNGSARSLKVSKTE